MFGITALGKAAAVIEQDSLAVAAMRMPEQLIHVYLPASIVSQGLLRMAVGSCEATAFCCL